MDDFKYKTPVGRQPRAMDGFFTRPAGASSGRPRQAAAHKPTVSSGRSIDDFRPSGARRTVSRTTQRVAADKPRPLLTNKLPSNFDLDLPEASSRRVKSKRKLSRTQKARTWILRTSVVSLVLLLGIGGLLFGKGYLKLQKVFQGGSSAVALDSEVDPTRLKGEGDGRVNVLLMGVGGAQHDGGDLTDTLMVASIDPVNNQAVLFSIPRDLWTKMPNNYVGNYNKINAAYESGKYAQAGRQVKGNGDRKAVLAGFQGIDGVIERVAGIPIHYNMLVDFKAFSQAVDTVGGVTVNTAEELRDPTMAWENGWNAVLAKKGTNNFNGKQALNYVRSRHTTSDFARGERQRAVMLALKDKTANLGTLTNPLKLSSLLSAFGDNIQSDISISDMTRMAAIMKKIPSSQIQSVGLTDPNNSFVTTGNINGLSVVMPKAGLEDYGQIQTYLRSKMKDGYIAKENATITVLNGSGIAGLATEKADELKSYGYNVGIVDNAPTEDYTKTQLVDLSKGSKKYTLNYLKKRLQIASLQTQVPADIVPGAANIVIILGSDAASSN